MQLSRPISAWVGLSGYRRYVIIDRNWIIKLDRILMLSWQYNLFVKSKAFRKLVTWNLELWSSRLGIFHKKHWELRSWVDSELPERSTFAFGFCHHKPRFEWKKGWKSSHIYFPQIASRIYDIHWLGAFLFIFLKIFFIVKYNSHRQKYTRHKSIAHVRIAKWIPVYPPFIETCELCYTSGLKWYALLCVWLLSRNSVFGRFMGVVCNTSFSFSLLCRILFCD